MPQPEAKFKQRLTKCFAEIHPYDGWWSYMRPAKIGTPDLVFAGLAQGTIWIEAKANSNPLSRGQELQISRMQRAGMKVRVIDAHMHHDGNGALLPWRDWSLSIDFRSSRRGNRICAGELMTTTDFWEDLFA